ncbi:MAG: ribonuclease PH [Rickettsiales bacterium]|nr:ribonuclease PH [Pseudomonadota bacterium]MDA0966765.1 ribonuclease PH [Pseudomonadota bacterium]MDG4543437.1 ribonuclease PH [Rickettsiales bacterium]MDG4546169.1 ribonuclease PH [Rickettsiales bacterium]MDG4547642.1 ribonuclease PH [Rickettsiales bacterium]
MRPSGRKNDELRNVEIQTDINMNADGSCLIKCGNTHVICTASIDEYIPHWMKGNKSGWVTAEYGMLPGSTSSRIRREAANGKQSGRTQEIQRLIGRSLRSVVDLKAIGERQIIVDCDVIQADGGTRTASITGGYVALHLAFDKLCRENKIAKLPFTNDMAAVSCGIYKGNVVLDLDYPEDSSAHADANFVMTGSGKIIEIQGTAEESPFESEQFLQMMEYAQNGIKNLIEKQKEALKIV